MLTSELHKKTIITDEEFKNIFSIIKQFDHIDEYDLKENRVGISFDDYMRVHNALFSKLKNKKEREEDYPTYYVEYKGYRFNIMKCNPPLVWCERIYDVY
jgi:hypothetical protein